MKNRSVRVRFAPSPTGLMHLGSVRIALFNYLFAKHYHGTFILRIEDTDLERNFDPGGAIIVEDLNWLNLQYQEGPGVGGPHKPYRQSERGTFYQEKLTELIKKNAAYRCFCTVQELERKRDRQIALKQPPRYDRACLKLMPEKIEQNLIDNLPFVWRFKMPDHEVNIIDLARGSVHFDLKNFSDFPITRQDGTCTFLFVNCVDDIMMDISHVIRGEDHLSNTANQVALYQAFAAEIPLFWHMPIICNAEGKKLSKRDFGFSLKDLRNAGYLPEAICNYLAIIGASFEQEIMPLSELAQKVNFNEVHTASTIKYDLDKLRWVNHQWIMKKTATEFIDLVRPYIMQAYPQAAALDAAKINALINSIHKEIVTLKESVSALQFYFNEPHVSREKLLEHIPADLLDKALAIVNAHQAFIGRPDDYMARIKKDAQAAQVPAKIVFLVTRMLLTGSAHGHSLIDIIHLLGENTAQKRMNEIRLLIRQ